MPPPQSTLPALPIDALLPELLEHLRRHGSVVLQAEPGAGKTTRVPPALLASGLCGDGRVLILEPRRVAARAAARRIADEQGWRLGDTVGYQVRFERRASADTRLLFVTEGVLVQRLQSDPFLDGIAAVVFDEFHERSLYLDLSLAMVRRLQREVRSDLGIVVMSATLETAPLAAFLGGAPVVRSPGRAFPVAIEHVERDDDRPLPQRVAAGVTRALVAQSGDVLAFLPGAGEIRATGELLTPLDRKGIRVLPLYGDLPAEEQDRALARHAERRVVLATNLAETSVTLDGVSAVVDSGLVREMRFDPGTGIDRLELVRCSRASAAQRAGRAGRQGPGWCLRLWTAAEDLALQPFAQPEVRRVDLAWAALQLLAWGERDLAAFPWFEAPSPAALSEAARLLRALGATDGTGVTSTGRALARLPLHPRLGRLVLAGAVRGVAPECALLAALLSDRDPLRGRVRHRASSRSDLLDRLEDLQAAAGARQIFQARDQILDLVRRATPADASQTAAGTTISSAARGLAAADAVRQALFAAFSDRLARRRERGSPRALMLGGRGVRLANDSAVTEDELFVAVTVDGGGSHPEALVRLASAVDRGELPAERVTTEVASYFDAGRRRVLARRRELFDGDLLLAETEIPAPLADAGSLLAAAAAQDLETAFALAAPPAATLLARWQFLADAMPELRLPEPTASLREALPTLAEGRRAFADLAALPVPEILLGALDARQRQALEREAPERLRVPSGSELKIEYAADRPPVLAARIQEMFGLRETPRLAGGRVPVLLHLLAPNGRPQQVTTDLASFWDGAYRAVRKELAGRYPKHAWPEDPWTARAERRPQRRPKT